MLQIAKAREIRGWTQEQLAQAIGTTQQTIHRWESGEVDPKISKIEDISRALGITVSFILGIGQDEKDYELSAEEREIIDIWRSLSPQGQQQLMVSANGCLSLYPKNNQLQNGQKAV